MDFYRRSLARADAPKELAKVLDRLAEQVMFVVRGSRAWRRLRHFGVPAWPPPRELDCSKASRMTLCGYNGSMARLRASTSVRIYLEYGGRSWEPMS